MARMEGTVLEGKVTGISSFGAFISLPGNQTGLVHISEVAPGFVKDIHEFLQVGQTVKVKVLTIDERGKISLSIKKAMPEKSRESKEKPVQPSKSSCPEEFVFTSSAQKENLSFEDKLNLYKQMSDERISDLRRNFESKRRNSYKRSMGSY
jgi:S1 RNA binding domain protein